jgi:hypothetical protein
MSDSTAPNSEFRFSSQEFLGYQPTSQPITPTLMIADVTGTLWRLMCTHWLAIVATSVFGSLLPGVVLEQVFNIKFIHLYFDFLRSDFFESLWTLAVSAWISLAMAFLVMHILSVELGQSIEWRDTVLKILPIIALSAILQVGMMAGFFLLVIPGIIFYIATILALPILLIENKSIRTSIQQSFEMTRGFRSKIFWVSVGLYILGAVLIFALTSLVKALGQVGGQMLTFEEVDAYLGRMGAVSEALFASAVYISLRKLLDGDEPDKLASAFD